MAVGVTAGFLRRSQFEPGILNKVIEKITPENNFTKYKVGRPTEYLILSLVLKI
jgi:hypothetical protein